MLRMGVGVGAWVGVGVGVEVRRQSSYRFGRGGWMFLVVVVVGPVVGRMEVEVGILSQFFIYCVRVRVRVY